MADGVKEIKYTGNPFRRKMGDPDVVIDPLTQKWGPEPIGQMRQIGGVQHVWDHEQRKWVPASGDEAAKQAVGAGTSLWQKAGGQ